MAVFIAACDESAGKTNRDTFYFGGFIGPEKDWSDFFVPAWYERVLARPPRIPFLHMTDIRSSRWREKYGISELQAEDRKQAAFDLLDQMRTFYPILIQVDAGVVRDAYSEIKITAPKKAPRDFQPDYLCFLVYVLTVLHYIHDNYPEVEKVDFIIEVNGEITKHIQEFHQTIAKNLELLGLPKLSKLVGKLIPGSKDRIPLQVADLLCWYTARSRKIKSMSRADVLRFYKISRRPGTLYPLKKRLIKKLATVLSNREH